MDLSRRAQPTDLPEWMDGPCDAATMAQTLRDLGSANRLTLAMRPVLDFLRPFAGETLHIVDVGSGGGDCLRAIARWATRTGTKVRLTGVDLNPLAVSAARDFTEEAIRQTRSLAHAEMLRGIEYVAADVFAWQPEDGVDLMIASLMTHHLEDEQIVQLLGRMESVARRGWLVNDLQRSRWAVHGFAALAWAARWHAFVRHDGPVSIRRSFREDDWRGYLAQAGIEGARIEPYFPGRLCVRRVRRG